MYMSTGLSAAPARSFPPISRYGRGVAIRVPAIRRRRARGLGQTEFTRPGPNGGTEIVDAAGNIIYSADQVAANPSLLTQLGAASSCPGGMLPTWFPGGESVCADPNAVTPEGNSPGPQFNYPINGQCAVAGWCMTGSDPLNPASYVWTGGGTPTVLNPAIVLSAGAPYSFPVSPEPLVPLATPQQAVYVSSDPGIVPVATPAPFPTVTPGATAPSPGSVPSAFQLAPASGVPVAAPYPTVVAPVAPSGNNSILDSLQNPVNVFGFSVPGWALGAGAIALALIFFGGSRR